MGFGTWMTSFAAAVVTLVAIPCFLFLGWLSEIVEDAAREQPKQE